MPTGSRNCSQCYTLQFCTVVYVLRLCSSVIETLKGSSVFCSNSVPFEIQRKAESCAAFHDIKIRLFCFSSFHRNSILKFVHLLGICYWFPLFCTELFDIILSFLDLKSINILSVKLALCKILFRLKFRCNAAKRSHILILCYCVLVITSNYLKAIMPKSQY